MVEINLAAISTDSGIRAFPRGRLNFRGHTRAGESQLT